MKINESIFCLALISSLTACGGGSGSGSGSDGKGNSGAGTTANAVKLTTQTNLTNSCGDKAPTSIDIVFHDANGKVVSNIKSSSVGRVDTALPKGTQHVSFIASVTEGLDAPKMFIDTYLDVASGLARDEVNFYLADQACECKYNSELDVTSLSSSHYDYELHGTENVIGRGVELGNSNNTINMCSDSQYAYLLLSKRYASDITAAKVDLSSDKVALSYLDFAHTGVQVDYIPAFNNDTTVFVSGGIEGQRVLSQYALSSMGEPMFIFPSLTTANTIRFRQNENIDTANGSITSSSLAYRNIDEQGFFEPIKQLPGYDIGYEFSNSFLTSFTTQNGNALSFDYLSFAPGSDLLIHSMNFNDYKHGEIQWDIFSEAKATIPEFEFGDILSQDTADENSVSLRFSLFDYNYNGSYVDLLNGFQRVPYEQRVINGLYDGAASVQISVRAN